MEETSNVKIPPFNFSVPQLWFIMVEATFEIAVSKPIISSVTKYNYCVAHITSEAAVIVRDVIVCSDRTNPYKHLKEDIVNDAVNPKRKKSDISSPARG
ncbi:hypothetical protein AVEN_177324-1 [Araneus ventricosus]|uniref:DUF7041 domain-containing protein n=1 Tax=Araneus ventricosus TaxID=182803 RepID=A0A4Y2C7J7_ARAVE|nr:hypothetical protein AVEN_177324-1 [Araneus ventricosus]